MIVCVDKEGRVGMELSHQPNKVWRGSSYVKSTHVRGRGFLYSIFTSYKGANRCFHCYLGTKKEHYAINPWNYI